VSYRSTWSGHPRKLYKSHNYNLVINTGRAFGHLLATTLADSGDRVVPGEQVGSRTIDHLADIVGWELASITVPGNERRLLAVCVDFLGEMRDRRAIEVLKEVSSSTVVRPETARIASRGLAGIHGVMPEVLEAAIFRDHPVVKREAWNRLSGIGRWWAARLLGAGDHVMAVPSIPESFGNMPSSDTNILVDLALTLTENPDVSPDIARRAVSMLTALAGKRDVAAVEHIAQDSSLPLGRRVSAVNVIDAVEARAVTRSRATGLVA
jgi:hypothetical protein